MPSRSLSVCAARTLARSPQVNILRYRTRGRLPTARHSSHRAAQDSGPHQAWKSISTTVLVAAATVALVYRLNEVQAETPASEPPELIIEKSKKRKGASKEVNRDLISSQHVQVKRSWENPGVYAWGSNTGKVVAPDSDDTYVKTPRRIPYFDDVLLRDLKLDRNFGAAILENGDLIQWGKAFSEDVTTPTVTLKGKDLKSVEISRDRIIALANNGTVYSMSASKAEQEAGYKQPESSWIPFWSRTADISFRTLKPQALGLGEKVTAISSGLEHVLLLTDSGRVFSAASGTENYPSRGQLGVPGVTWLTRPEGAYDMCHELTTLRGFNIEKIATGDRHSLALDREGRVFAFGDNSSGQLGFDCNPESAFVDSPSLLPINKLYQGTNQVPKATSISAGGLNSFFAVDATRISGPSEDPADIKNLGQVTADVWACGEGIRGSLGTGKWTHIQDQLTKIPSLSGLFEYDERNRAIIPIRMAQISVGSTHASAVMANVTYLNASEKTSDDDTNWGADVVWWGGNEFYQLGTGRRNNVATPQYIRPLDMEAEIEAGRKDEHRLHLTPKHRVKVRGRKVDMQQRVECGRNVTAVYSAV